MEISNTNDTGVLLIAQGRVRYLNMAINLVKSLRLNHGNIPVALVSDMEINDKQKKYFDHIIPVNLNFGKGFSQKIRMYTYSPFQKTLFIDVDCLVIRSIDFILKGFEGKHCSVMGKYKQSGDFIGTTIEKIQLIYPEAKKFIAFNGGVYYFEKGAKAQQVFELAVDIFDNQYANLGLHLFNGKPGDEPAMAIAMAAHNCTSFDDDNKGMYTPVGIKGNIKIDVLKAICRFKKYENEVSPAIMHFGGGYPEAFHYRREIAKINLVHTYKFPRALASFLVNISWNPVYATYVFMYRVAKKIVKGGTFKVTPALPMFKFE